MCNKLYFRYNDYSNSKFGNISIYSTPVNYSSSLLKRGSSLQDVSSPLRNSTRRLTRHSSLDKEVPSMFQQKRSTALPIGYFEQSYYDHVRSGRSLPRGKPTKEGKKRRPISCNKVGQYWFYMLIHSRTLLPYLVWFIFLSASQMNCLFVCWLAGGQSNQNVQNLYNT